MTLNHKVTGRAMSIPAGLAFGASVSVLMTLMMAAVTAKLISAQMIEETSIGYGIMLILLSSSFTGALTAACKVKRQRLLVCALSGAVYLVILLSVTALFFGGQYEAVGVTSLLVFGGCTAAGFVGIREKRGTRSRKIRMANR